MSTRKSFRVRCASPPSRGWGHASSTGATPRDGARSHRRTSRTAPKAPFDLRANAITSCAARNPEVRAADRELTPKRSARRRGQKRCENKLYPQTSASAGRRHADHRRASSVSAANRDGINTSVLITACDQLLGRPPARGRHIGRDGTASVAAGRRHASVDRGISRATIIGSPAGGALPRATDHIVGDTPHRERRDARGCVHAHHPKSFKGDGRDESSTGYNIDSAESRHPINENLRHASESLIVTETTMKIAIHAPLLPCSSHQAIAHHSPIASPHEASTLGHRHGVSMGQNRPRGFTRRGRRRRQGRELGHRDEPASHRLARLRSTTLKRGDQGRSCPSAAQR